MGLVFLGLGGFMNRFGAISAFYKLFAALVVFALLQACSAAPRHQLTNEEKTADLYWLFSQFNENYAPLAYKQQRYGFTFDGLKTQYLQQAQTTKTNEEFYLLMHRFVAEFRDAHTASSLSASTLPARTFVAYLGFDGARSGNALLVQKLLPTISADSNYPIKVGDKITKLDGVPLIDIVRQEFINYRNLGQDESNLTYHLPKIFSRNSLAQALPTRENAVLTVTRDSKELTITLPWVVKDLYTFTREQRDAADAKKKTSLPSTFLGHLDESVFFKLGFQQLNGEIKITPRIAKWLTREMPGYRYQDSFVFVDTAPTWASRMLSQILAEASGDTGTPVEELKKERNVPDNAIFIDSAKTYPTYVTMESMLDKDGKPTKEKKAVAYIYLNTFSPSTAEDDVVKEFTSTLLVLKTFGVHELIIDLINNGGGSLNLGGRLAQALSNQRIVAPQMQFKLSETWLDDFQTNSLNGSSDSEKEIARRVFVGLTKDKEANLPLSRPWDYESLTPFSLTPNADLDENFHITLLTNEMCASMCDIFTATLVDNKMADTVGSRTMGAGGNVVAHRDAPNSHLTVNQTESMILRRDGSPLENNGVEPTTPMSVNETVSDKYEPVRKKALELILKAK